MQVFFPINEKLNLLVLNVSAANHSHLQGTTDVKYMYSVLRKLSNTNASIFRNYAVLLKY
jgi:hypothetical protein